MVGRTPKARATKASIKNKINVSFVHASEDAFCLAVGDGEITNETMF